MMKKYLAEAMGTFLLVFAGCGAIVVNETNIGSLGNIGISAVFGLIIMIIIYSYGDISGAHFNPAVTLCFFVAKKISIKDSLIYILAQTVGAIFAAIILRVVFPSFITLGVTSPSGSLLQSFFVEFLLTFILMTVILSVSSEHNKAVNISGIAIGAAVFIDAAIGGPISGASMNPARSLGPAIAAGNLESIWIYLIAPVLGAIVALPVFNKINKV